MNIPKEIKVGCITYQIEFKIIRTKGILGYHEATAKTNKIVVDSRLNEEKKLNVLIHELTHAALYELGHDLTADEFFVQSLANIVHGIVTQFK